ncbi:MAG TPA: ATP-binding protein [Terriglobales bacterium]|jgi:predicted kinase
MRKWMAERLKRRKKKAEAAPNESKASPLQPAYFDAEPNAAPEEVAEPIAANDPEPVEAEPEAPAEAAEPQANSEPAQGERNFNRGNSQSRRRRRGGRGRGRSSQQNVARDAAQQSSPAEAAPVAPATPRAPKGTVILAIGLPGSGKSSWFKRNNITPLSTDMLRTLLFDDATEQRFQDLVFSNLRSMLKARLIARRPLNYVDATNLTPQERHSWIKLAKDFGYEVQAVYFDVPADVCLERNQKRERKVDEAILRRMADKLKAPTFDEGFTKITVVKVKKKENQPPKEISPEE